MARLRFDHLVIGPEIDRFRIIVILDTIVETDQIGPITLSSALIHLQQHTL